MVTDKRAELYNRLVASYHKAKTDRAGMAQELESAKGNLAVLAFLFSCTSRLTP
jgi:hypothetical protein